MATNTYPRGSQVKVSATFSISGVNTDPDTVTLKVIAPNTPQSTQTPDRVGAGQYASVLTCAQSGLWKYRFEGTGVAAGAAEGEFFVALTPFV